MTIKNAIFAAPICMALTAFSAHADQNMMRLDHKMLNHFSDTMTFASNGTDTVKVSMLKQQDAKTKTQTRAIKPLYGDTSTQKLKSLISRAESPRLGYDSVVLSAKRKPNRPPSQMTLREVFQWIRATPNQNHAIGRYQFIPATLKRLVNKTGLPHDVRFDPKTQDMLADVLLQEAGYHSFLTGRMSRHRFMNGLARIWAGLPTSNGRSYYHGHAGNRATISWAHYDAAMQDIFSNADKAKANVARLRF